MARIDRAIESLVEEALEQIVRTTAGWNEDDEPYTVFIGPGDLLAALSLDTTHVGDLCVIPAVEGRRRALMGPVSVPLLVDRRFPFRLRLCVGNCWNAQEEAVRVAAMFVEVGAVGMQREAWMLVCTKHYLCFGPVKAPKSRFTVVAFECKRVEQRENAH